MIKEQNIPAAETPQLPASMSASAAQDRGAVSFHVWQSLSLGPRLAISFALIGAGMVVQAILYLFGTNAFLAFMAGTPLLVTGNSFLLIKGYHNRIDWKAFDPHSTWEVVGRDRLRRVIELDRALRRWDTSAMEITSVRGFLTLLLFLVVGGVAVIFVPVPIKILSLDALILIVPQWFTGTKRILTLPALLVKAEATEALLKSVEPYFSGATLDVYMLLKGTEKRVPEDIKFRISFENQSPDFLGLYGQTTTNDVQGSSYPYFYTVLVARKGFGLAKAFQGYQPPAGIVKEYDEQGEVELIIVRQHTTKTSGYHTDHAASVTIFQQGYDLARAVAPRATPA